ncbi:MAG: hypothetical protein GX262_11965 [Clostridia bacterium]|nr:hypothetical protein [Clostridia bacterium]
MNKKLFLAIAMVILAFFLVAGCGGGATQPQEPETPPADSQPAETEVADSEPADSEPADSEPADSEPADSEPADSEPADSEPADSKPAESEPADSKPAEEAKPEEPQKEADASGDKKELGPPSDASCSGCHGSLDNTIAGVDGHPQMPMESLSSCGGCHGAGSSMGVLKDILHDAHGSMGCESCHK